MALTTEQFEALKKKLQTQKQGLEQSQFSQVSKPEAVAEQERDDKGTIMKIGEGVVNLMPNLAKGFWKGVGTTAFQTGQLIDKGVAKLTGQESLTKQLTGQKTQEKPDFLKPKGITQNVGYVAEKGAELLAPGSSSLKVGQAVTASKALAQTPKLAKIAGLGARAVTEAGLAGGTILAQTGDVEDAKVGAAFGAALPVVGAGLSKAWKLVKPEASEAIFRAIKPRLTKFRNLATVQSDMTKANQAIVENGFKPTDLKSYVDAIKQTKAKIWGKVSTLVKEGGKQNIVVDLTKIADAIDEKLSSNTVLEIADDAGLAKAQKLIENIRKRGNLTIPEAEDLKHLLNAQLEGAYGQFNLSKTEQNVRKMVNSELGKQLNEILSAVPDQFKNLKKTYGALSSIQDDVMKRLIVFERQNPMGLIESIGNISGFGDILMGVASGQPGRALKGLAEITTGRAIKNLNNADNMIKRGFDDIFKALKGSELPSVLKGRIFGETQLPKGLAPQGAKNTAKTAEAKLPQALAKTETKEAQIINPDELKKKFNDYNPANHEKYAEMAKQQYAEALQNNPNPLVKFTAGGSGSGKSELILKKITDGFNGIVVDGVLGNFESASKKIQQALDAGKQVEINAILPRVQSALKFVQKRAMDTGRDVPFKSFVQLHSGFMETLPKLIKEFPDIKVSVLDNRFNFSEKAALSAKPITDKAKILDIFSKLETSTDALTAKLKNVKYSGLIVQDFRNNLKKVVDEINQGGITFDVVKNSSLGGKPYTSVAIYPERSQTFSGQLKMGDILKYVRDNLDLLSKKNHTLGGWYDTESKQLWLDVAGVVKDEGKAVNLGKEYNQKAVFNLERFEEIPTGGTGESIKGLPSIEERAKILEKIND